MNYEKAFKEIMKEQVVIALSTSVGNKPNVRIVNFCFLENESGVIYFSTFSGADKIEEFKRNSMVAFITIPKTGNKFVRIKNAKVVKSELSIYDLKDAFTKKEKNYGIMIESVGSKLEVYELRFNKADVVIDSMNMGTIEL